MANRYFSSKKTGPKITFKMLRSKRKSILEKLNELDFSKEDSIKEAVSEFEREGLNTLASNFKKLSI